jgi:hypothetical protein
MQPSFSLLSKLHTRECVFELLPLCMNLINVPFSTHTSYFENFMFLKVMLRNAFRIFLMQVL